MRGLTASEYAELVELAAPFPGEEVRNDAEEALLEVLVEQGRAQLLVLPGDEEYEDGEEYSITPQGHLALRLWPAIRAERP